MDPANIINKEDIKEQDEKNKVINAIDDDLESVDIELESLYYTSEEEN